MNKNDKVISILQQHVEQAVSLIRSLKQKATSLEAQNQKLIAENMKYKADIDQYASKLHSYEENMKTFEKLLDDAQNEQAQLEQSILSAINGLGNVDDSISTVKKASPRQVQKPDIQQESLFDDNSYSDSEEEFMGDEEHVDVF